MLTMRRRIPLKNAQSPRNLHAAARAAFPHQVEVQSFEFVMLQRQALVEIERQASGTKIARLTQRGSEVLLKLSGLADDEQD
jgi:hypothetical protein